MNDPQDLLRQAHEAFCQKAAALSSQAEAKSRESRQLAEEAEELTRLSCDAQRSADAIAMILTPTAPPAPAPAAATTPEEAPQIECSSPSVVVDLTKLQASLTAGRSLVVPPPRTLPDPRPIVEGLLDDLKTEPLLNPGATLLDVDTLIKACATPLCDLPPRLNLLATTLLTARLRRCQEACFVLRLDAKETQIAGLIRRLSAHSEETRPGFVHGLARDHKPRFNTWVADAREARAALAAALDDVAPAPPSLDDRVRLLTERCRAERLEGPALAKEVKALVAAGLSASDTRLVNLAMPCAEYLDGRVLAPLRKAVAELAADVSTEDTAAIPVEWPLLSRVRGHRAIIVGGSPRPERSLRIREEFEFQEIDWSEHTPRRVQAIAARMRSGVGIAILLQPFIDHKTSDTLFAAATANFPAVLAGGYGINQIRLGLERYLGKGATT